MKSYKNLYLQVCSLENVMAAARSAMQGKMSGHAAARFHARWETHAVRLHEELTTDTWRPGPYTYFDIHEPKVRRVAAAPFRDRSERPVDAPEDRGRQAGGAQTRRIH